MSYRSFQKATNYNGIAGDGKSHQGALFNLDPNFSPEGGILSKYLSSEESSSYNIDHYNQNRAFGADSDLTSYTPGNTAHTTSIKDDSNYVESELRGGSTISDLHHTENITDTGISKPMKSNRFTPIKQPRPKGTKKTDRSEISEDPSNATHDRDSQDRRTSGRLSGKNGEHIPRASMGNKDHDLAAATAAADSRRSSAKRSRVSEHAPRPPVNLDRTTTAKNETESEETTKNISTRESRNISTQRQRTNKSVSSRRSRTPGSPKSGQRGRTRDSDVYSYSSASESESTESGLRTPRQLFKKPDPTALRDLDNASPETVELCNRHAVHYCFFVYFPPATVDEDLLPFRRKSFADKVAKLDDPELIKEVSETRCARDAFADRRLISIEKRSGTEIRLGELYPNLPFIRGLPRRRLTIAGPSFANICCALNIFEQLLPSVIKAGVFPYRLPKGASTRFCTGNRNSSAHNWGYGKSNGSVTLRKQIDDKGGWRSFLPVSGNVISE